MNKVTAKQYILTDIRSNNTNLSKELADLRDTVSAIRISIEGEPHNKERAMMDACNMASEQIKEALHMLGFALQEIQKLQTNEES